MPAYAHRMDGITGSAIRELFKLLSKGDIISFGGGNPSSSSFPVEQVKGTLQTQMQIQKVPKILVDIRI